MTNPDRQFHDLTALTGIPGRVSDREFDHVADNQMLAAEWRCQLSPQLLLFISFDAVDVGFLSSGNLQLYLFVSDLIGF